jgi:hypothetical protein
MVPRGIPAAVAAKLNQEVIKILKVPEVSTAFASTGNDPVMSTPEPFAALIKVDYEKWGKVAREIKLEGWLMPRRPRLNLAEVPQHIIQFIQAPRGDCMT